MRLSRTDGHTLLEVLISLAVLSLGVLGVLALLLSTLRVAQHVNAESVALHLASDMADQLRANGSAIAPVQFDYDAATSSVVPESSPANCYGLAGACSTAQLAALVLDEWRALIKTRLPGGRVRICRDTAPWQSGTNALRWECNPGSMANAPLWIKLGWQDHPALASGAGSTVPQLVLHVE